MYDELLKDVPLPKHVKDNIKKKLEEIKADEETAKKIIERCVEVYYRNLVEPGEAVGIVAAQSIGEPATQMSLPYDERVVILENDRVRVVEIGKFVDNCLEKFEFKTVGIHEICDLPIDVYALSLDRDEKVRWKRIRSVVRHRFKGKLIRIRTRSGRVVRATPFHSFVVRRNNEIVPIEGRMLKVGDRIPVVRFTPLNCISKVDVSQFTDCKVVGNYVTPTNGKRFPKEIELDFEAGYFFGMYLADGYSAKYFVSIANNSREIREVIKRFAERFGLNYAEYVNRNGFSESVDVRIYSKVLSDLARSFGNNAKDKRIPEFVYSANKEFVRGLLRGYFDGNGNSVERKAIRFYSSSKELIDGIAFLLTRFGIFGVKKKMGGQYGLIIYGKYAKKFAEEIGSFVKADKLEKIEVNRADIIDVIPSFGKTLTECAKKVGYPLYLVRKFERKQKIGRVTLEKHLNAMKRLGYAEEMEVLERALDSDVVWDEIVEIDYVDYDGYVYDFSVPDSETFTTFEGIVTHNTMRTFHYAGVAEINVTLGLPRLIEILDVRKKPSTPMMTIRLLPEYAKDKEKAKEVARRIEATHVTDVADISVDIYGLKIVIKPDDKALKEKGLTLENLKKTLEKKLKVEIEEENGNLVIQVSPDVDKPYKTLMDIFDRLKREVIAGIKEIKRVIIRKEGDEYVLYTEGSNLKKVMKVKGVDYTRTLTNDIYEIYEVLGIEAARSAIIKEAKETLEEQGLDVDVRHIMLVADVMTADGYLKQIGRHGVAGGKQSILARAAFEVTVNVLLDAAVRGEVDYLKGITENIIVGQPIRLGTGDVELVYKPKR